MSVLLVSSARSSACEIFTCRLSPEGVDIFLDCLCGEECNRGYSLLKPMGKYILYGKYIFIRKFQAFEQQTICQEMALRCVALLMELTSLHKFYQSHPVV
jgi:hypothetical protein